jgi:hypothetical protein
MYNFALLSFHLIGHSVAFHAFYSFNLGRRLRITEHASCNWKEYSITGGSLSVLDKSVIKYTTDKVEEMSIA